MRQIYTLLFLSVALITSLLLSCGSSDDDANPVDTDPNVTDFINLIGGWERTHKAGRYEYIFREDGSYTRNAYDLEKRTPMQTTDGSFSLDSGILTLTVFATDGSNQALARQSKPYVLLTDIWYPDQVYRKDVPDEGLLGSWTMVEKHYTYKADTETITLDSTRIDILVFQEDGTFTYDAELQDEKNKLIPDPSTGKAAIDIHLSGTYFVEDDAIYAHDDHADRKFQMLNQRLYHDDNSWRYERVY